MRTPDLKLRYLGTPCYKGHNGWRYRRGGRCVQCAEIVGRDRRALINDACDESRPKRRDEFQAAIDRAAEHMYKAGLDLWLAKDQQVRGWRQALSRHGLTQRLAAELRRFAYKRQTGQDLPRRKKTDTDKGPDDWLGTNTDDNDLKV